MTGGGGSAFRRKKGFLRGCPRLMAKFLFEETVFALWAFLVALTGYRLLSLGLGIREASTAEGFWPRLIRPPALLFLATAAGFALLLTTRDLNRVVVSGSLSAIVACGFVLKSSVANLEGSDTLRKPHAISLCLHRTVVIPILIASCCLLEIARRTYFSSQKQGGAVGNAVILAQILLAGLAAWIVEPRHRQESDDGRRR